MKIETDKVHVKVSGVRHGKTIGSPVAIEIINRTGKLGREASRREAGDPAKHQAAFLARPGHVTAGALEIQLSRRSASVLERASARESTSASPGHFCQASARHLVSRLLATSFVWAASSSVPRRGMKLPQLLSATKILLSCVDEATGSPHERRSGSGCANGDNGWERVLAEKNGACRTGNLRQLG